MNACDAKTTIVLHRDGFSLTVSQAPQERNRYERGIKEVMRRSVMTQNVSCTWNQFRAYALDELGILTDPLLDQPKSNLGHLQGWGGPESWEA